MTDDAQLTEQELADQEKQDFLDSFEGKEVPDREEAPEEQPEEGAAPENHEDQPEETPEEQPEEVDYGIPSEAVARLRQELKQEVAQEFSGRLRNLEGNVGGIKQKLDQLSTAKQAAESQGADAPTNTQIKEAMESGDKLNSLKDDFPEWAEALQEGLDRVAQRIPNVNVDDINQRLNQNAEAAEQSTAKAVYLARQMQKLDSQYPDWEETIQSDQYINWLHNQPPEIQAKTDSEDARDALEVLEKYHTETSQPDLTAQESRQKNHQRLEQAVAPTSGQTTRRQQHKTEHEEFLEAFQS